MQIVGPIDVEEAVAAELAVALPTKTVTASPPPDDLSAGTIVIQSVGGFEQSEVSDGCDLVIYAYEATYSAAMATGMAACGAVRTLRLAGGGASGVAFTTSTARPPYEDPDPDRVTLARVTVQATVGVRGTTIYS